MPNYPRRIAGPSLALLLTLLPSSGLAAPALQPTHQTLPSAGTASARPSQQPPPVTSTAALILGEQHQIRSALLQETQSYSVFLPTNYDPNRSYPVIYLLDGPDHSRKLLGIIEGLSDGLWPALPDLILVGLDNRQRMRDYTPTHTLLLPNGEPGAATYAQSGGGPRFLDFIEQELKPRLASQYATSGVSILIGHSFGGLLALEALRSGRQFNAYIAIDPSLWFDYPGYYQQLTHGLTASAPATPAALFIAASDNAFTPGLGLSQRHRELIGELGSTLAASGNAPSRKPGLTAEYRFYPASDHSSLVLPALHEGLLWLFDGYRLPFNGVVNRATFPRSDEVIARYTQLNQRLGSAFKPERADLRYQWAYLQQRVGENAADTLFTNLLQHYYPQQPVQPRGQMAH